MNTGGRGLAAPRRRVAVTGLAVLSAHGRGPEPLLRAAGTGTPAFGPVTRFDTSARAAHAAAELAGPGPDLADELRTAIGAARTMAGLPASGRPYPSAEMDGADPLLLAVHADARTAAVTAAVHREHPVERVYTCACVAGSTAAAAGAARISAGLADRVVVAAGYLVEPDTFAVFDAGRALARDGRARPFSADRSGLLLGDAVAAVVLEAGDTATGTPLAWLDGWARTGDAHHVCRPAPDGSGLARAMRAALDRAGLGADAVGYVNANATGSAQADGAEAAALAEVFAAPVPLSSTKSVHGHALEASALLELVVTVETVRAGTLPVNAGLGEPLAAGLDLVREPGRRLATPHAMTVNSAFGGANTALVVSRA